METVDQNSNRVIPGKLKMAVKSFVRVRVYTVHGDVTDVSVQYVWLFVSKISRSESCG